MSKLELKIIPPLVVLIFAFFMWAVTKYTPEITILVQYKNIFLIGFVILGLALMFLSAAQFFKRKTTINPLRPDKSSTLVTSGFYKFSRNPIYLADLIILIGWGLYLSNIFSLALAVGFIFYMNRFQIKPEERILEEKFGDEYINYKNTVRRWI